MCHHLLEHNPIPCNMVKVNALWPKFHDKNGARSSSSLLASSSPHLLVLGVTVTTVRYSSLSWCPSGHLPTPTNSLLMCVCAPRPSLSRCFAGELFFDHFALLIEAFPPFLFPLMRLQEHMQTANLGVKFWTAKKREFGIARSRLGMKRKH
jgi:hypothetical protein